MRKLVVGIFTLIMCFISTAINDICWLFVTISSQYVVPDEFQAVVNVVLAILFIILHICTYVKIYKKCLNNYVSPKVFAVICMVPYIVLIILAAYWFATFPLL